MLFTSYTATALRFVTRVFINPGVGLDDIFASFSLVSKTIDYSTLTDANSLDSQSIVGSYMESSNWVRAKARYRWML
jgi:hypothetical protein